MLNLASAILKVHRAYQHIRDIELWCKQYGEINPHDIGFRVNPTTGEFTSEFYITARSPILPENAVECLIGDAVHNLRAALDHVASALYIANDRDSQRATFPIDNNRNSLIHKAEYIEIQGMSVKLSTAIADFVDKYAAGNLLVGLNHLDRADKHRLVITATAIAEVTLRCIANANELGATGNSWPTGTYFCLPGGKYPEPGTAAFLHNESNRKAPVEICFGEGETFEYQPVIPTMHQLLQMVSGFIETIAAL